MTQLAPPSGLFGHFFAARAAVQDAAQAIAANPNQPDTQRVLEDFRRYHQANGSVTAERALEKFMVQVREHLKNDEITVDPLVMYSLQFRIATALEISN